MQQNVRWAVVGTSDFALDWIAGGIRMGGNSVLAAVVSRSAERAEAAAQRVGAPHSYPSIEAIVPAAVDGVFLVLPNPQHAPYAIAAARRHLHVVSEKPMAPTLVECDEMIAAARASGAVLAVAHCMAWAPPVAKARELVASGAIGEVISATITASFNSPPVPPFDPKWEVYFEQRLGQNGRRPEGTTETTVPLERTRRHLSGL